ncbi:MAG: choice-of-anchor D domain-containing protein [Candidatus Hatepunaea meridiana]|nr:choice-of-anchor D domain-containing protein [Candidatus Hatepunaea meridiana]
MKHSIVLLVALTLAVMAGSAYGVEEFKITAEDADAEDFFGTSVSIDGDFAIVGAPYDDDEGENSGSAYIFVREGEEWFQQQKLIANDAAAGNFFGWSVSIDGGYVIIGAYQDDDDGGGSGSAYIFTRDGEEWNQQEKLTAADADEGDYFGNSVSINGNYVVVGSPRDDDNGASSGSAYIFVREDEEWTQQQKLTANDAAEDDFFGYSVSIHGNYAVIGAYQNDDDGEDSGSAYIFELNDGEWTEQQKLTASDAADNDGFGRSVSINDEQIIIGSPFSDGNDDEEMAGSAYIFKLDGDEWREHSKIVAGDSDAGDRFGLNVAIYRNYCLIAASFTDDNGDNSGSAYLFRYSDDDDDWTEIEALTASDAAAADEFGNFVSISGDYAVIGSRNDDDDGANSGAVYIYSGFIFPQNILVSPNNLNFVAVYVNESEELTLTITNEGELNLTVSDIVVEGDYFTIDFEEETTIEPEGDLDVVVTFAPEEEGEFNGTLTITSNDPEQEEIIVNLRGVARDAFPDIAVEPEELDFEEVFTYDRNELTLTISNEGDADLIVREISIEHPYFRTDFVDEMVIQPDGSEEITVTFIPERIGDFEAELTIQSDDPDENPLMVALLGNGRMEIPEVGFWNTPGNALEVIVINDVAYVADNRLRIFDVSDPANPSEIGSTGSSTPEVDIVGNYAYTASGYSGLRIIDISDPNSPEEIGNYNPDGRNCESVTVNGSFAYIYIWYRQQYTNSYFQIIDISNSENPRLRSSIGGRNYPVYYDICIIGNYALAACNNGHYKLLDISNPDSPQIVIDDISFIASANKTTIVNDYAYVAVGNHGIQIADISDPPHPDSVSIFDTPGSAQDVCIIDNYAYIADGNEGLRVYDISDIHDVQEIAFYNTPGYAYDVEVVGRYAYVADGGLGLRIYDIWGGQPAIVLPANEIDFGEIAVGTQDTEVIEIRNEGNVNLTIFSATIQGECFSVDEGSFVIEPNAVYRLTVTFDPAEVGDFQGTLTIRSNDPDNREMIIDLFGSGGGATWRVDIAASVGDQSDAENYAGGAIGAGFGYDEWLDIPEPHHAPNNYISLYFPHPEWEQPFFDNYTCDIVSDTAYVHSPVMWEFEVDTDIEDQTVTLEFNSEGLPDDELPLILEDITASRMVDLLVENSYEYNSGEGGINEFRLHYGGLYIEHTFNPGWNLISLPVEPNDARIREVIGDDVEGLYYLYVHNPDNGFHRLNAGDELMNGIGYWMILENEAVIDVSGTVVSDTVRYDLNQGWNLIGDPFIRTTSLENALFRTDENTYTLDEAADENLVQPVLYSWDNAENDYVEGETMTPWFGNWFAGLGEDVEMLLFPVQEEDQRRMPVDFEEPLPENWSLTISAVMEGSSDRTTTLGATENSSNGFDAGYDYLEPPHPPNGNHLSAYFEHNDWDDVFADRFNHDIRAVLERNEVIEWTLSVVSRQEGEVTLSWDDIEDTTPYGYSFILIDEEANESIDMLNNDAYTYFSDENHSFIIQVEASIGVGDLREATISFVEGWNLISLNVSPVDDYWENEDDEGPAVLLMLNQLRDEENNYVFTKMKDEVGDFCAPRWNYFGIDYWNQDEGYLFKMREDLQASWWGVVIDPQTEMEIEAGWNIIAYYPDYDLPADRANDFYVVSSIVDNVIIAKDAMGGFMVPGWNFSNMSPWTPGQGYQINVDDDVVFVYPEEPEEGAMAVNPNGRQECLPYLSKAHWTPPAPTGENMSVLVTSISGVEVEDGAQIAAFSTSGNLVGVGVIADGISGLAIWGDDKTTDDVVEGLLEGEDFTLRLCGASDDCEQNLTITCIKQGTDLVYSKDGFLVIEAAAVPPIPDEFYLSYAYPNPFNAVTTISYGLPDASDISLRIYDISGRLIVTLYNNHREAGHYKVVWNAETAAAGIYCVHMKADGFDYVRKVVLVK